MALHQQELGLLSALSRLSEQDDPALADRLIGLFLSGTSEPEDRMAALRRLQQAYMEMEIADDRLAAATQRDGPGRHERPPVKRTPSASE